MTTPAFMQLFPGAITVHPPQQFYIGDTWEIACACADGDGAAIDLSAATVTWVLCDSTRANVYELAVGDGIQLLENTSGELITGRLVVELSSARSGTLTPGVSYYDELTVVTGGKTLTQFRGRIDTLAKLPGAVSG